MKWMMRSSGWLALAGSVLLAGCMSRLAPGIVVMNAPAAPPPTAEARFMGKTVTIALPADATRDTAKYPAFADNPWQQVSEAPVSTFGASVDSASQGLFTLRQGVAL